MDVPTFVIRDAASGESFTFTPPLNLWLDMLAYQEVFGGTLEELIRAAVDRLVNQEYPKKVN